MKQMTRYFFIIVVLFLVSLVGPTEADDRELLSKNIVSSPELIARGKTVYSTNCTTCHGPEGKGDGPAATAFTPKPRNFYAEPFKQGGAPSQIFLTLTNGMGSMPSFSSLAVEDRMSVVHYIYTLNPNKAKESPESLAKIGLGPDYKPLADFQEDQSPELPVSFIMERMAVDGNIRSLKPKDLIKEQEKQKAGPVVTAPPPTAPTPPDLERGKKLYVYCKTCHGEKGEGSPLVGAPQLSGQDTDYIIAQFTKFQTGVRGAHPNDESGLKMRPMAQLLQNREDLIHLAHYIHQLKTVKPSRTLEGGDVERGKTAFAMCSSCHGADAKGIKALSAPSLRYLQDWYILAQIQKFKEGYRGSDPRDTMGAQMKGMAMTLNEQMVRDITAYLETLDSK